MLHDYLGVNKAELEAFLASPDEFIKQSGKYYAHKNRSVTDSISLKFDKYVFEKIKVYIKSQAPTQSVFCAKSIRQMIQDHSANKYVLVVDLKNYFESVKSRMVVDEFLKINIISEKTEELVKFYFGPNDSLRRGLVASAAISELVGIKIDGKVGKLINDDKDGHNFNYSRYYDDIVISAQNRSALTNIKAEFESNIEQLGLQINRDKSFIRATHGSTILGIRIHDGKLMAPKKFRNRLRALIHNYPGLQEHELEDVYEKLHAVGAIIGSIRYVIQVTSEEIQSFRNELRYYLNELERLKDKETELINQAYEEQFGKA